MYLSRRKAAYDTADPSEGLMNILKKMYAEGDDEMKRTINKAWVESREKQYKGDIPMDIWKYSKGRLKTDLPCETRCAAKIIVYITFFQAKTVIFHFRLEKIFK